MSKSDWQKAAAELLAQEKELTRRSDELSQRRRELPWRRVVEDYVFEGPQGRVGLAELFGGRSQLAVYHFMFGPDWTEGCPGCSYVTDHIDGALEHLRARDVSLVLVSRGPLDKLLAFRQRMGWHLPWVSSGASPFNRDFGVSFTKEELAAGAPLYSFGTTVPHGEENPGMSFFYKDPAGAIFHTYSIYGRGLETLLAAYMILDRAPKGRDESELPMPMAWVRHHDKYEPTVQGIEPCCHNDKR
ncbi:MAG TPA: thioredoxin family protein [Pirellulales bacterium]|nr:thioredoxin family protein [Pirellulales bacterium]